VFQGLTDFLGPLQPGALVEDATAYRQVAVQVLLAALFVQALGQGFKGGEAFPSLFGQLFQFPQ